MENRNRRYGFAETSLQQGASLFHGRLNSGTIEACDLKDEGCGGDDISRQVDIDLER
jgi:hypothetical protein